MRSILLLLLCTLQIQWLSAQKIEAITTRTVSVKKNDSLFVASILVKEKKIRLDNTCVYYWYGKGDIKKNYGAFDKKPLHGEYTVYDNNSNMIVRGNFKYGLQTDTWKYWDSAGNLRAVLHFKKGKQHGVQLYYENDSIIKIHYSAGKAKRCNKADAVNAAASEIQEENGDDTFQSTKEEEQSDDKEQNEADISTNEVQKKGIIKRVLFFLD